MSPQSPQSPDAPVIVDARLLHDLRGPTLNALAFNDELIEATKALWAILIDPDREISQQERQQISEILKDDIQPCVEFVRKALVSMEERLKLAGDANNSAS